MKLPHFMTMRILRCNGVLSVKVCIILPMEKEIMVTEVYGVRNDQHGMLKHADMPGNGLVHNQRAAMRHQNITDATYNHRPTQADQNGFEQVPLVSPEHR